MDSQAAVGSDQDRPDGVAEHRTNSDEVSDGLARKGDNTDARPEETSTNAYSRRLNAFQAVPVVDGTSLEAPKPQLGQAQASQASQAYRPLRHSHPHLTEAARDPRDEAPHVTPSTSRSASPYTQSPPIDFDGLSWPSKTLTPSRTPYT